MIVTELVVERALPYHQIMRAKGKAAVLPMIGALAFLPNEEPRND
jgi:hypothetical protein